MILWWINFIDGGFVISMLIIGGSSSIIVLIENMVKET